MRRVIRILTALILLSSSSVLLAEIESSYNDYSLSVGSVFGSLGSPGSFGSDSLPFVGPLPSLKDSVKGEFQRTISNNFVKVDPTKNIPVFEPFYVGKGHHVITKKQKKSLSELLEKYKKFLTRLSEETNENMRKGVGNKIAERGLAETFTGNGAENEINSQSPVQLPGGAISRVEGGAKEGGTVTKSRKGGEDGDEEVEEEGEEESSDATPTVDGQLNQNGGFDNSAPGVEEVRDWVRCVIEFASDPYVSNAGPELEEALMEVLLAAIRLFEYRTNASLSNAFEGGSGPNVSQVGSVKEGGVEQETNFSMFVENKLVDEFNHALERLQKQGVPGTGYFFGYLFNYNVGEWAAEINPQSCEILFKKPPTMLTEKAIEVRADGPVNLERALTRAANNHYIYLSLKHDMLSGEIAKSVMIIDRMLKLKLLRGIELYDERGVEGFENVRIEMPALDLQGMPYYRHISHPAFGLLHGILDVLIANPDSFLYALDFGSFLPKNAEEALQLREKLERVNGLRCVSFQKVQISGNERGKLELLSLMLSGLSLHTVSFAYSILPRDFGLLTDMLRQLKIRFFSIDRVKFDESNTIEFVKNGAANTIYEYDHGNAVRVDRRFFQGYFRGFRVIWIDGREIHFDGNGEVTHIIELRHDNEGVSNMNFSAQEWTYFDFRELEKPDQKK